MRYVILAKGGHKGFDIPRQLSVIGGERILDRTIRLLKENGINSKDIIVTGRYKDLGDVIVYDPIDNTYNYDTDEGYWLDAFPYEFLVEPVCFVWGDVYFSEQAIKTIVETKTDSTLFFCSYLNRSFRYIKRHDEPFAYKVLDTKLFKKHIERVKKLYDEGKTDRHPIVWELYRSINGIDVNEHKLKDNVVIINDITCDIDSPADIKKIEGRIGNMVRLKITEGVFFNEEKMKTLKDMARANPQDNASNYLYIGDVFLCDDKMAEYITNKGITGKVEGGNPQNRPFAKVIEVIPDEKPVEKAEKKTTRRTRKTK